MVCQSETRCEANSTPRKHSLKSWRGALQQARSSGLHLVLTPALSVVNSVINKFSITLETQYKVSRVSSSLNLGSVGLHKIGASLINHKNSLRAFLILNTSSSWEGTCGGFQYSFLFLGVGEVALGGQVEEQHLLVFSARRTLPSTSGHTHTAR